MVIQTSTNKWAVAKFIVDPTAGLGSFTTITAACAAASSGDVIAIRQGTYTEDFTLPAGITLTALGDCGDVPTVTIIGKITMTAAGTSAIYGCRLQTNSDYCLVVSGSNACGLRIEDCYVNCTNNTGINYTNSNVASFLTFIKTKTDTTTTGIALITSTASPQVSFFSCNLQNSGNSSTASSTSSGQITIDNCSGRTIFSTSSSGIITINNSNFTTSNFILVTTAGTGSCFVLNSNISTGTNSAFSVGAGTVLNLATCAIASSNANAITGTGTFAYSSITFTGSSSTINATLTKSALVTSNGTMNLINPLTVANGGTGLATLTAHSIQVGNGTSNVTQLGVGATGTVLTGVTGSDPAFSATPTVTSLTFGSGTALSNYAEGTFTPTFIGQTSAGTTTYTVQQGYYTRIGNLVYIQLNVAGSAATGTGNINIDGLPFTIKNQTGGFPVGTVTLNAALTWPAGGTSLCCVGISNSTHLTLTTNATAAASSNIQMANVAFNVFCTIMHQI